MMSDFFIEWQCSFPRLGTLKTLTAALMVAVKTVARLITRRKTFPVFGLYPQIEKFALNQVRGPVVLMSSNDCDVGSGAFRSCVSMARHLREKHQYEVIVVLSQTGSGEPLLQEAGVPYLVIPSAWWLVQAEPPATKTMRRMVMEFELNHVAIRNWRALIQKSRASLIHINSMATYVAGIAALRMSIPVIWHLRDMLEEDHNYKIYNRELGYQLVGSARRIISVSECVRKKYARIFGADRVVKVLNGVDLDRFYRPEHKILDGGTPILLFLGNLERKKGPVEFTLACCELSRRNICKFQIWFVGGYAPQMKEELDKHFSAAGLCERVTYWGSQPRPEDYLEKADVACVCSRCEAFGRVTVEMMLTGCLVVGADTGGTVELINHGKTGLLYHRVENDASDLADKLYDALAHSARSQDMADRGRSFMFGHMSSERNADEVAAVYKEVLSNEA